MLHVSPAQVLPKNLTIGAEPGIFAGFINWPLFVVRVTFWYYHTITKIVYFHVQNLLNPKLFYSYNDSKLVNSKNPVNTVNAKWDHSHMKANCCWLISKIEMEEKSTCKFNHEYHSPLDWCIFCNVENTSRTADAICGIIFLKPW